MGVAQSAFHRSDLCRPQLRCVDLPSDASYLLKLADRLTFEQVVLLAFWEAAQDEARPYRQEVTSAGIRVAEGLSRPTATILNEMNDLATAGLLGVTNSDGQLVRVGETLGSLAGFQTFGGGVDLATVQLTDMGQTLYRLMGLSQMPDGHLKQIAAALHGMPAGPPTALGAAAPERRRSPTRCVCLAFTRRQDWRCNNGSPCDTDFGRTRA